MAHELLTAVSRVSEAPERVARREERAWLRLALQALGLAGEHAAAARLHLALGQYARARAAHLKAGDPKAAALACVTGAHAYKVCTTPGLTTAVGCGCVAGDGKVVKWCAKVVNHC